VIDDEFGLVDGPILDWRPAMQAARGLG